MEKRKGKEGTVLPKWYGEFQSHQRRKGKVFSLKFTNQTFPLKLIFNKNVLPFWFNGKLGEQFEVFRLAKKIGCACAFPLLSNVAYCCNEILTEYWHLSRFLSQAHSRPQSRLSLLAGGVLERR